MDEQEPKEEEQNVKTEHTERDNFKIKVGTVGNFVFAGFFILILGTAGLISFLIRVERESYDEHFDALVSNLNNVQEQNITSDETETEEEKENTSDQNVQTIANIIDSAISDNTDVSGITSKDAAKQVLNEKLVVLYNGLILDVSKMDEVTLQYIDSTSQEKDKYVITYYSYENYSFKESKLGTLSNKIVGNLVKIDNVGKIAISEDYNAMPRDVKVINTIPDVIADDMKSYDTIKTIIVDLDGNGTEEYILALANKTTGYSKITLYDAKGNKINDLASIEKSRWKKDTNTEYYLSISNVEVVDVDNDGIMEIVLEIPHGTGDSTVSLLKYNNGKLSGKTGIECSLLTE